MFHADIREQEADFGLLNLQLLLQTVRTSRRISLRASSFYTLQMDLMSFVV